MRKVYKFTTSFFLLLFIPINADALPFDIGEKLEFDLKWGNISAGRMTMEVPETVELNGKDAIHLTSSSKSNGFVSTFYKLNSRIDCFLDPEGLSLLKYEVVNKKNGRERRKTAIFNAETGEVQFTRNNEVSTHKVPPDVNGSLSIFYYIRTLDLGPDKVYQIDTFSNGKLYKTTVKVMEKETINVKAGKFNTIKVKSIVKESDMLKSRGETVIWFSDDEHKTPVRIKTKIKIGHMTADLRKADRGKNIAKVEGFSAVTAVKGHSKK